MKFLPLAWQILRQPLLLTRLSASIEPLLIACTISPSDADPKSTDLSLLCAYHWWARSPYVLNAWFKRAVASSFGDSSMDLFSGPWTSWSVVRDRPADVTGSRTMVAPSLATYLGALCEPGIWPRRRVAATLVGRCTANTAVFSPTRNVIRPL